MSGVICEKACFALEKLAIHDAGECAREKIAPSLELQNAMEFLLEYYTVRNSFTAGLFIAILEQAND